MKKLFSVIIPALMIVPVFLSAQMESITISSNVFKSGSRSPVIFSHGRHMSLNEVSCNVCHHRFENGINVLDPSELTESNKSVYCSSCHRSESGLRTAYHRLCIGCHQEMVNTNKPSGPRLCGECHK